MPARVAEPVRVAFVQGFRPGILGRNDRENVTRHRLAQGSDVQNSILAEAEPAKMERLNSAKIEFCTSEPSQHATARRYPSGHYPFPRIRTLRLQ